MGGLRGGGWSLYKEQSILITFVAYDQKGQWREGTSGGESETQKAVLSTTAHKHLHPVNTVRVWGDRPAVTAAAFAGRLCSSPSVCNSVQLSPLSRGLKPVHQLPPCRILSHNKEKARVRWPRRPPQHLT